MTEGTRVRRQVFLVLSLELLDEVVYKTVVKVFSTEVSVTGCGLDFKDTLFNDQKGDIEGSSTKIEDKNITLAGDFLVETVGDSGSRGLVDNTKDVQTRNGASILSGLTLGVIEIRGNCDDGIVANCAKI
jgi:hypothetical protein